MSARDGEEDRDGAQGLGHAADAGGLLPHQPVALAQVLVLAARLHPTHPKLGRDVGGAGDRRAAIRGEDDAERVALGVRHALGEAADDLQAFGQDVDQPELFQGKGGDPLRGSR